MQSNVEIAWSYFYLQHQGKMEEALDLLHEGGTFWNVRTRAYTPVPVQKDYIRKVFDKVPMKFTLVDAFEDGDTAILELESHAIRSDGKEYNNVYAFVIKIFEGKLLHVREYQNTGIAEEMIAFLNS